MCVQIASVIYHLITVSGDEVFNRMAHYNLSFMYRYSHNTIEVGYKLLRIAVIYENVNNASLQEALY